MSGLGRTILGAALGAVLGLVILIPLGLFLGGLTGSVWSPDRTLAGNLLAGLWRAVRPHWL